MEVILSIILEMFISWLLTCGIVYLISLCFGFIFSWAVGTGVWIILLLLCFIIKKLGDI